MIPAGTLPIARGNAWAWWPSWPLLAALAGFVLVLSRGSKLIADGDTFWHLATGRWVLAHGRVPTQDPFSHTMPGAAWTAHEWLAGVTLALLHQAGGWHAVVVLTAAAFGLTLAILMRALLRHLEPIHALLFVGLAVAQTLPHLAARPHVLALVPLVAWVAALAQARGAGRVPSLWLLPLMVLWANLHASFMLGLVFASGFALEAVLAAWRTADRRASLRGWGRFMVLAAACALLTPHGWDGIAYVWHVHAKLKLALSWIGEWRSPNFQQGSPLMVWLLSLLAASLWLGLRLPAMRLAMLLGLVYLALKHARYIELLGLLGPLVIAAPLAAQLRRRARVPASGLDRLFARLAVPAGRGASAVALGVVLALSAAWQRTQPVQPADAMAPAAALHAAQAAGLTGPVFNEYVWGGFLIHEGVAPFIDGRADMYGDGLLQAYLNVLQPRELARVQHTLDTYQITWTLLPAQSLAVALLDASGQWRRVHADAVAVVHARQPDAQPPVSAPTHTPRENP